MIQTTNTIMMVRPANFGHNAETAQNNAFQSNERGESSKTIAEKARLEFDRMVATLREKGVDVTVIEDTDVPTKPDAIFPNNWISFHRSGVVITYPMFAENRRIERREEIIDEIGKNFIVDRRYSFEHYEEEGMFLEGTGSMLLDRQNNSLYACLSPRTDARLIDKYAVLMQADMNIFHATDRNGQPIYHTNVMMALGEDFCVLVKDSIRDDEELDTLVNKLESTGKEIIDITFDQMEAYAGNMLQVRNAHGELFLVMSQSAYDSLNEDQISRLESKTNILSIDIDTIEYYGGGSVRCMMAEIFLPRKN